MTKSRASIFAQDDPLDISGFTPKTANEKPAPAPAELRAVSEAANFPSRENKPPAPPRGQRRHRTGRNVQLNLKVSQEVAEAFYAITDQQGWVLGETLEHAIAALQKNLGELKK